MQNNSKVIYSDNGTINWTEDDVPYSQYRRGISVPLPFRRKNDWLQSLDLWERC